MKIKELQSKSEAELKKLLQEQNSQLNELRFRVSSGQLKDVRDIREARKTVAKILTLLAKKKITS